MIKQLVQFKKKIIRDVWPLGAVIIRMQDNSNPVQNI